jgi:type I restriction enzyme M protein
MADALRGSMDAAEYKHVARGLIFLKDISDAFEERQAYLRNAVDDPKDEYYLPTETRNRADTVALLLEDPDEYRAFNIFRVPLEACWGHLKAQARQPTITQLVDEARTGNESCTSMAIRRTSKSRRHTPCWSKRRCSQRPGQRREEGA